MVLQFLWSRDLLLHRSYIKLIFEGSYDDELFLWNGWTTKDDKPYSPSGSLSEVLTIGNLWYAASRIYTCTEPESRLCVMKLCSSNNHYTIDCTSFGVIILFPLTSTTFFSVNIFMFLSSFHFNVFVFGDCKVHHNDWLIYETGETDKPVGLYYNFPIPNNLTQMVHFTTQICDCDSHVPFLLDFFHLSLVFAQ